MKKRSDMSTVMSVKEEVKTLLGYAGVTMTQLAALMSEKSGLKYTMKSVSDKLARQTLKHEEFSLILKVLDYRVEYIKDNTRIIIQENIIKNSKK